MHIDQDAQRKQIERFIRRIPSLSTTVGKVLEICSKVDASPNELNKVTSLTRAITMLGLNTVKNMALSTAIIRTVSGAKKSKVLPTKKFWAHSISVGVSAKLLAKVKDIPLMEREEYFISGLLHDLGKVPFGDEYIHVLSKAKREQIPLIEAERELLGIDHQEVGLMIAEKWKLNKAISSCIGNHHDLDQVDNQYQRQAAFVALGNVYSAIYDIGFAGDLYPSEQEIEKLLDMTELSWLEFADIRDEIDVEIEKAQIFLQV